jgi:hypothetical protein
MTSNIIVALIFVFVYFFIYYLIHVMDSKMVRLDKEDMKDVSLVLLVKNAEEHIEKIINILDREGWNLKEENKVSIVDMNSVDNTKKILRKIDQNGTRLNLLEFTDKEKVFEKFNQ